MMRMMKKMLVVSMLSAISSGLLAADSVATPTAAAVSSVAPVPATSPLFMKPVFLRGSLGDQNVQVNIRPKEQVDEGLEGEYFVFGRSLKILLAGEMEGTTLFMEESENGTNISGQWDGKLDGDMLSGTWMSADGSVTKPFSLKIIPVETSQPSLPKKVAANAKK
jgi:hypothetical protein